MHCNMEPEALFRMRTTGPQAKPRRCAGCAAQACARCSRCAPALPLAGLLTTCSRRIARSTSGRTAGRAPRRTRRRPRSRPPSPARPVPRVCLHARSARSRHACLALQCSSQTARRSPSPASAGMPGRHGAGSHAWPLQGPCRQSAAQHGQRRRARFGAEVARTLVPRAPRSLPARPARWAGRAGGPGPAVGCATRGRHCRHTAAGSPPAGPRARS